jgi:hypothetical protein
MRSASDRDSISMYPDTNRRQNYDVIQIQRNCGDDNKCIPDLEVQSKL